MRRLDLAASLAIVGALVSAGCWPVREAAPASERSTVVSAALVSRRPATAPPRARDLVSRLVVKGRAPRTGYDRGRFGAAWADVDRNGCDTRVICTR